jgi:hypothetical protein
MKPDHLKRVIEYCTDTRLVVIDTLSRVHDLDENSNSDMARLVATLEHIADSTEASILFLHHVNKGSARDGQVDQQQAVRGASALVDNSRWCGYVSKMTEEEAKRLSDRMDRQPIGKERRGYFIRFGISKQNYHVTPRDQWYERREEGVLLPVELLEAKRDKNGNGGGREQV